MNVWVQKKNGERRKDEMNIYNLDGYNWINEKPNSFFSSVIYSHFYNVNVF